MDREREKVPESEDVTECWVLILEEWDMYQILGVYSSRERAMGQLPNVNWEWKWDSWVYKWGASLYVIREYRVDARRKDRGI